MAKETFLSTGLRFLHDTFTKHLRRTRNSEGKKCLLLYEQSCISINLWQCDKTHKCRKHSP